MECNKDRIRLDIETIAGFNSTPGQGTTRFTYSDEDIKAREYLIKEMERTGLKVSVDQMGNIRARLDGKDDSLPIVMTGSHIDTVTNGGNFDGVAGVSAGLEALRTLVENKFQPECSIELIVFVEEEGPNFKFPLAGSRILTGKFPVSSLKKHFNSKGVSMHDAAVARGFDPSDMRRHLFKEGEIKAMIELHIEQSVVLDELSVPVGVVGAVAGRKWIEIEIAGKSNHAGATPMNFRNDPMDGAAKVIASLRDIVTESANPTTVGTVGKIDCFPNEPNVIPEKVCFTVDVRDIEKDGIEIVERELVELTEETCEKHGLEFSSRVLSETEPIIFSKKVVESIIESAKDKCIEYIEMNSGALHDSCLMAEITDVGMIFVPSVGGRSHCAEETTDYEDIKKGADVLLGALIKISEA